MEIRYNIDMKVIRKAFAMVDMDIPPDEEIKERLSNTVIDLSTLTKDKDMQDAELGFALLAIGFAFENKV